MKIENVTKLIKAETKIVEALNYIREVANAESWGTGKADCAHFAHEIQEFLSCDRGEGGFTAYLLNVLKRQVRNHE